MIASDETDYTALRMPWYSPILLSSHLSFEAENVTEQYRFLMVEGQSHGIFCGPYAHSGSCEELMPPRCVGNRTFLFFPIPILFFSFGPTIQRDMMSDVAHPRFHPLSVVRLLRRRQNYA